MKDLKNYLRKQNRRDWTEKECFFCKRIFREKDVVFLAEYGPYKQGYGQEIWACEACLLGKITELKRRGRNRKILPEKGAVKPE